MYKRQQWNWGDVERGAFEEIKRKFSKMIMMNHPDFDKVFYLQTDASNVAVGAELYQAVSYTHLDVYKRQCRDRQENGKWSEYLLCSLINVLF